MDVTFDDTELRAFAADLTRAGDLVASDVEPVVVKGAVNIKDQLIAEARASTHFAPMARSIDFDIHGGQMFGVGIVEAEIGPNAERDPAGHLDNIAYFGTSRGGGTVPDPIGALEAEIPGFQRAIADLGERAL